MELLSVNAAIEQINELLGTDVAIFGQVSLDFEGHCISHLPRAERLPQSNSGIYTSSIWTRFDLEALGQREQWLMQFDARHVVLRGTLYGPEPGYNGSGHFGLWPAEIVVRSVAKPWTLSSGPTRPRNGEAGNNRFHRRSRATRLEDGSLSARSR